MICKKCNNEIPDDSKFCIKCGASISKEPNNVQISLGKKELTIAIGVVCAVLLLLLLVGKGLGKSKAEKMADKTSENLGIENAEDVKEINKIYEEILKEETETANRENINEDENIEELNADVPIDNKKPLDGIILMSNGYDDRGNLKNIRIYNIDPTTGKTEFVRLFSNLDIYSLAIDGFFRSGNFWRDGYFYQSIVNKDFTKMCRSVDKEDGSTHVGWYDQEGEFTDVTEMVLVETSDFEKVVPKHAYPLFTRDGKFFYYTDLNTNTIYRVPLNNICPESVQEILGDTPTDYALDVDGTPRTGNYLNEIKIGPDGIITGNLGSCTDWIDNIHVLTHGKDMIYNVEVTPDKMYPTQVTPNDIEVIPKVEGRIVYSPVLSPDRKKVVFISYDSNAADRTYDLFITSVDGSTSPQKIDVDMEINSRAEIIDWVDKNDDIGLWEEIMLSGKFGDTEMIKQFSDEEICKRVKEHYAATFGEDDIETKIYSKSANGYQIDVICNDWISDTYYLKPDLTGKMNYAKMTVDLK